MTEERISGPAWTEPELDQIVADYFLMLADEKAGRPYNKSAHRSELMRYVRRPAGSIEFKHQNISAVLARLGLRWIKGYLPRAHYQKSLVEAVERYLLAHPDVLAISLPETADLAEEAPLFEEQPPSLSPSEDTPPSLERLIRKFDPSERDFRNRKLGRAGEERVLEHERRTLSALDRPDLARKVRWVSEEDGDGAGYDILSFEPSGLERHIEVKTTCGGQRTPFYLTRNERAFSDERPDTFRLYRLYEFDRRPRMFELRPPLENVLRLEPLTYRASFS